VPAADDDPALDASLAGRDSRLDRWRDRRTYLGAVGGVFVLLGLLVLAFVAYQLWGTDIQEARAQRDLRHRFDEMLSSTVPPASTVPASTAVDTTAVPVVRPSTGTVRRPVVQAMEPSPTVPTPDEPSSHPEIKDGDPVARLEIPAIGLDKIVVSGVFSDDLKHGPGHYPATPLPGEVGNAGIAGHRTTYGSPFGDLDKLQPDDEIIITTTAGRFRYVVVGTKIVQPSDASVLAPSTDVRLTLTTCDPRYSTAHRLIVTAVLDTRSPNEPVATAPATTSPPVAPATDVSVTTIPAPTTTVSDVTTPTLPPTTPPTTSAATTVPATTTPVSVEQQVNDAYLAYWPRYWACLRNPTSCIPDQLTAQQGTARQALTKTVEDFRKGNLHVGDEDPGYAVIEKTVVDVVAQKAAVDSCVWDTDVLYGPPAKPGGRETIVNNLRFSKMYQHDLYLEDGAWKIGEQRELSRGPEGINQCPPNPLASPASPLRSG
jgi:sortase A